MAQARIAFIIGILAVASCKSDSNNASDGSSPAGDDGGSGDAGSPSGADGSVDSPRIPSSWTCSPRDYADGVICHCDCGSPDPDCANPSLLVSNCSSDQVCAPNGTCTVCGNRALDTGEQCDSARPDKTECGPQGFAPGQVPCDASCTWAYDQCMPLATCGNGMLDDAELCDGASVKPGLDCTDYARASGSLACTQRCAIDTAGCYTCGDGSVEGPEACDDGGVRAGDGCSDACAVETGWQCTGKRSTCTPVCGDGRVLGRETCDDGNATSNDGCSADCKAEMDCQCAGAPSVCNCATVQTIATVLQRPMIDVGGIVVDSARQPHMVYGTTSDFNETTGTTSSVQFIERKTTGGFSTTQIDLWSQSQGGFGLDDMVIANDGGTIRLFYQRGGDPTHAFATVTFNQLGGWQFAGDKVSDVRDVARAGGVWHSLVVPTPFGSIHYRAGDIGAWAPDDTLAGLTVNNNPRLAIASTGGVYISSEARPSGNNSSYSLKLAKRVDATTYSTEYDVTTTPATGTSCVVLVSHEPVALPGGGMVVFEDGFNPNQRWLKAHRLSGASWVIEDVADLSFLSKSCTAGGSASYSVIRSVTAVDAAGLPHILYAAAPVIGSTRLEDHYRDTTGWHVRTFPITGAAPLAMTFDANNAAHIFALAPSGNALQLNLVYIRIDATRWN